MDDIRPRVITPGLYREASPTNTAFRKVTALALSIHHFVTCFAKSIHSLTLIYTYQPAFSGAYGYLPDLCVDRECFGRYAAVHGKHNSHSHHMQCLLRACHQQKEEWLYYVNSTSSLCKPTQRAIFLLVFFCLLQGVPCADYICICSDKASSQTDLD